MPPEAGTEAAQGNGAGRWLAPRLDDEDREVVLDLLEGLESTRVNILLPMFLGMMAGVGVVLFVLWDSLA